MKPQNTPWNLNEDGDIVGVDGNLVPIVGVSLPARNHPDRKAAETNRLLLASAPELLEALEAALKAMATASPAYAYQLDDYLEAEETIKRAIAKAKGQ